MPYTGQLKINLNIFRFFFGCYAISYFLPVAPKLNYGFEAAFYATLSMLDRTDWFIGGLANFVILILLFIWIIQFFRKSSPKLSLFSKLFHILYIAIAAVSVSIWYFTRESPSPLYSGYYVWAFSTVGMCTAHWNYKRLRDLQYRTEEAKKEDGNLLGHLIE